jgi:putative phosphoesterase
MKLGILSDTHNNQETLRRALAIFRRENVTTLIHCGDMTTPQTAALMTNFKVIHVSGNMANAPGAIRRALLALNPESVSGPAFSGRLGGVWVAAAHGHAAYQLDTFVRDGRYAYIFHGHTHRRRDERVGQTRIINPGALGGIRHEDRSICLVELGGDDARFVTVEER